MREATAAFGVPAVELEDWEADDLIATYAREACAAGGQVTIVSSDKDLMQLIRPGVMMQDPIKQKMIGPPEVMEKFGVAPDRLIEVQALMGDSVDNVPGVPGIGPKTAAQLVVEFGDLEGVLAAAPAMKPSKRRDALIAHAEAARISRQLVILRDDAPLPMPVEAFAVREPDRTALSDFLTRQGFRSTLLRLGLEQGGTEPAVSPGPPGDMLPPDTPAVPFGPYDLVTTGEALAGWIGQAHAAGMIALKVITETDDALTAEPVGLAMATGPGRAATCRSATSSILRRPR